MDSQVAPHPAFGSTTYDVVIAGAGPTGLTLANLLGQSGCKVLLIERNPSTVPEPRAVSIDDESLRTMQAMGLLDEVMSKVVPGYGLRYLTPSGKTFLSVAPSERPYGHPRRNAFRQPVFENQLRVALDRFPNVDTLFGTHVTDFTESDNSVAIEISDANGHHRVQSAYLVGCDGASSLVRKKLGFVLEGETPPDRWIVVDLENSPADRDTLVHCDPKRPSIALPGPNNTRRFEFKLFPGEDEAAILAEPSITEMLRRYGAAGESHIIRKTVYSFHARVASRWSRGRVFIAGDAAHLTPPFAGQGMNSGIRDAHNLAWKLAAVLEGALPARVLDSYETERRDHVSQMIQLAIDTGRVMAPSGPIIAFAMQTALRAASAIPFLRSYFGEMKYKPKPKFRGGFIVPSGNALVGSLLPQPMTRADEGQGRLLDEALGPGFVLLGVGLTPDETLKATRHRVWRRLEAARVTLNAGADASDLVRTLQCEPSRIDESTGEILVVRPDRYVMASFAPGAEQDVAMALEALLGAPAADTAPPAEEEQPLAFSGAAQR